jgi:hypothetical protein
MNVNPLTAAPALLAFAAAIPAQCASIAQPGPAFPGISGFGVHVAMHWDPDGAGPMPELLVVGGFFDLAGNLQVENVVAYDPTARQFVPLFSNLQIIPSMATVLANGSLVVAAPSGDVRQWTGSSWASLNAPVGSYYALAGLQNGELVLGGAANPGSSGLLRWNGTSWQSMATLTATSTPASS